MGFVMSAARILDNVQLDANGYIIKIKEVESGAGKVWHGQYMVMDPVGKQVTLPGVHTTEPTFGLPATWIEASLKEEAAVKGYTVVDSATVLATHLTELIKANMSELLSYGEVQKLIKELPKEQGDLIKDIVPAHITISGTQRVLQILLAERVSICDLATILEGIADGLAATRNPAMLAEHVRARLSRQLCAQHTSLAGHLPIIALTARWEQVFAESIVGQGDDRNLAMQPSKLTEFINLVREKFEQAARDGEAPVLVTSPGIRPFVRGIGRALPRADERAGAIGDSPASAAQDSHEYLRRSGWRLGPAAKSHGLPVVRKPRGTGTTPAFTGYHGRSRFSEVRFRAESECVNHA
jgi:flagellar biosynthesis protein FlhA